MKEKRHLTHEKWVKKFIMLQINSLMMNLYNTNEEFGYVPLVLYVATEFYIDLAHDFEIYNSNETIIQLRKQLCSYKHEYSKE